MRCSALCTLVVSFNTSKTVFYYQLLWLHIYHCVQLNAVLLSSSSVSGAQQTTPHIASSDECHQLVAVRRHSCVYNSWRSHRWQHAMKPDISRESQFLPTPPAFDAPVRWSPTHYCYEVWYRKTRMSLPDSGKRIRGYDYSFRQNTRTWRTDRQTDGRHRTTA